MKTSKLLVFILLILAAACSGNKKNKETLNTWNDLKDQVMDVHDEVMPKMGELMNLKQQIDEKISALKEGQGDDAQIEALEGISKDLDNSHEKMMQWMREYDSNFEGMVENEILTYLEDQKNKIEQVGKITTQSIEAAKKALE